MNASRCMYVCVCMRISLGQLERETFRQDRLLDVIRFCANGVKSFERSIRQLPRNVRDLFIYNSIYFMYIFKAMLKHRRNVNSDCNVLLYFSSHSSIHNSLCIKWRVCSYAYSFQYVYIFPILSQFNTHRMCVHYVNIYCENVVLPV